MNCDELRKKNFELECALGQAMKLLSECQERMLKMKQGSDRMAEMAEGLSNGVKKYLETMDKRVLIDCVNSLHESIKTQNPFKPST